jgi:hypothetical protein
MVLPGVSPDFCPPIAPVKNSASKLVHNVGICIHNLRNPNKEEWDAFLAVTMAGRRAAGDDLSSFKQLVFTDGGGPNAAQRKAATDIVRDAKNGVELKIAVVSRSLVARGIVTAFRWLGFPLRSFAPDELEEAFAFLEVSKAEALDICLAVEELCSLVSGPIRSASRVEAYRIKLSA